MNIDEKVIAITENMDKVYAAGARAAGGTGGGTDLSVTLPSFTLDIEEQDGTSKTCVIYGYIAGEYDNSHGLPTFDLKIEEKDGKEVTYKVFGYEVTGVTE